MNKLDAFFSLSSLFKSHGYRLYLVGGAVRDYLILNELNDLDVVSDATPNEVKTFYTDEASYVFERFGAVTLKYQGYHFDLTTLREEKTYLDSRHPHEIVFIKDLSKDVIRRDFTINALYMDDELKIYDYVNGLNDINNKIIRMIGDPNIRIKEDPLRILRAIRFSLIFNFEIEENLKNVIKENISLLDNLNPQKILEEMKKMKKNKEELRETFNDFHILYLLDMLK